MEDQGALLNLFSAMALGWVHQWVMMGPKNVPVLLAYGSLAIATVLLYWWATPEAVTQFQANWRFALVGVINFFLAARGTGAVSAAAKAAPKTDTI